MGGVWFLMRSSWYGEWFAEVEDWPSKSKARFSAEHPKEKAPAPLPHRKQKKENYLLRVDEDLMAEPNGSDYSLLIDQVYPQIREIAGRLLRKERDDHTLQRTALVHEAFLRMFGKGQPRNLAPEDYLIFAVHQMRQILIDYGRKHRAKKRGGDYSRVALFESEHAAVARDEDSLLDLNEALERLGQLDPRALSVVELKFFGGCTNAEAAEALRVSDGTIEAVWLHARLWLYRELNSPAKNVQKPEAS